MSKLAVSNIWIISAWICIDDRCKRQPLMRRKTSAAAKAMRLLPSTKGWLIARLSTREAQWDAVHALIAAAGIEWRRETNDRQSEPVLLRGLLLIERVVIADSGLEIIWRDQGWQELAGELVPSTIGAELQEWEQQEVEARNRMCRPWAQPRPANAGMAGR